MAYLAAGPLFDVRRQGDHRFLTVSPAPSRTIDKVVGSGARDFALEAAWKK
jgi:hypothetical protein